MMQLCKKCHYACLATKKFIFPRLSEKFLSISYNFNSILKMYHGVILNINIWYTWNRPCPQEPTISCLTSMGTMMHVTINYFCQYG